MTNSLATNNAWDYVGILLIFFGAALNGFAIWEDATGRTPKLFGLVLWQFDYEVAGIVLIIFGFVLWYIEFTSQS